MNAKNSYFHTPRGGRQVHTIVYVPTTTKTKYIWSMSPLILFYSNKTYTCGVIQN